MFVTRFCRTSSRRRGIRSGPVQSLGSLGLERAARDPLLKPLMPPKALPDGGMAGSVLWVFHFPLPLSTLKRFSKEHPRLGLVGRCRWDLEGPSLFQPFNPMLLTSYMVDTVGLRTCFPRRSPDIREAVTSRPPRQWPCVHPTGLSLFLSNLPVWSSEVIS